MKHLFFAILIGVLTIGCNQKNDRIYKVTQYYKAFDASDYAQIKTLIADSITIIEGDYTMPFSQETYYKQFKWDSVFQPTYRIKELYESKDTIIATVEVHSLRFEFLKNNPLTCTHKIYFESEKLSKFENIECLDADWNVWQRERDTLVKWINIHHPELDGFIHDLTMKGAIKYLKAIELYKNRKDD